MKKMFFVIVALLCATQIVKADGPKGYGFLKPTLRGALEPAEFKKGMTVLFTKGSTNSQIAEYFQQIPGFTFQQMKSVYKKHIEETFGVENITDEEMLEVIEKTEFREVEDGYWGNSHSMYIPSGSKSFSSMEWWQPKNTRNNEFIGSVSLGGLKKDWVTTFCANPVKTSAKQVVKRTFDKPVERQEQKQEYVYIPGTTKIIEHGTDTVKEIFSTYKEVDRNTFNKINNQTFTLEAQQASYVQSGCNHQQVQQCNHQVQQASCNHQQVQQDCGCREDYSCQGHKKVKNKKSFFNTTGGKLLLFGAGVVTGAVLENNTNINLFGGRNALQGQVVTHGPLNLLPVSNPVIFTHGPLN